MARNDARLEAVEKQVTKLAEKVEEQSRIQQAALRRTHLLPANIANLIEAEDVSAGTLTPDGQGMSYAIGGGIQVVIRPYAEEFELIDATGGNAPEVIAFGAQEDFDKSKVLAIAGYAALAKRSEPGDTVTDHLRRLNGVPAFA